MLYPIKEGNKFGFINAGGETLVKPAYDFVGEFSEGHCCVGIEKKVNRHGKILKGVLCSGYINERGEEVIHPEYVGVGGSFNEGLAMVQVQPEWKYGFINPLGQLLIKAIYDQPYSNGFSEGYADVALGEKWGYINKQGETVIGFEYDQTFPFKNGFAIVKKNTKKWFIDTEGKKLKTIIGNLDESVCGGFKEGLALVKVNKMYGFINTRGALAFENLFEQAWGFHEGLCAVSKDGKYGYINKKGMFVIDPQFENARPHHRGIATFSENGKWGLLNGKGEIIKKPEYDYIDHFGASNGDLSLITDKELSSATLGNKEYYINRSGEIVSPKIINASNIPEKKSFWKKLFKKKVPEKAVWDKASWYMDSNVAEKSAGRHIYFILNWLKNKDLLTKEGLEALQDKNNVEIGIYRSMVKHRAAKFLDQFYTIWYENESMINFQIDSGLKFQGSENLDSYWQDFLNQ